MNFTDLKYYDELSASAQIEARKNIVASEIYHANKELTLAKEDFNKNLHKCINDRYHVTRLYNGRAALRKIRQIGESYLISYIRSNLCIFTECGAYISYIDEFVIVSDGNRFKCKEKDKKTLKDSYVMVNERGSEYHRELFTKIKRSMYDK